MYRSYSVNNMPQPVNTVKETEEPPKAEPKPLKKEQPTPLSGLKSDDFLLILIIFILIFNECDDRLLLLALLYIFFSDYFG